MSTAPESHVRPVFNPSLHRRFEAVMFDWDGTAVPARSADASAIRESLEELCSLGMDIAVVSGTSVRNVDGQLGARPPGPGSLYLLLNRGSEAFRVGRSGPDRIDLRTATAGEDRALTGAGERTIQMLRQRGVSAALVSDRLNRRKVDVMPDPAWDDPSKAQLGSLVAAVTERLNAHGLAGLEEVAAIARLAATQAGLTDPRVSSDGKYVEIGLTDKSDSARWFLGALRREGVGAGLLLIAGDEMGPLAGLPGSDSFMLVDEADRATAISVGPEPGGVPPGVLHVEGGPPAFLRILQDQVTRRRRGDVPDVDEDPGWTIVVEGLDPKLERAHEATLTIADGTLGTRGAPILHHPAAAPGVVMSGLYEGHGAQSRLLEAPLWHRLQGRLSEGSGLRRVLDMRTGTLHQSIAGGEGGGEPGGTAGSTRALLFASVRRPGVAALRGQGPNARKGRPLRPPRGRPEIKPDHHGSRAWAQVTGDPGGAAGLAGVALDEPGEGDRLDRFAAYAPDHAGTGDARTKADRLVSLAATTGFDVLLREQRRSWADRWQDAEVCIEGDPELTRALRFSLFHILSSAGREGEAAVGARGLTGPAYLGHVFWDADVFVLPSLAATHPAAARAVLEYRVRRLPAAMEEARSRGLAGARFPWESARSGRDVTPQKATALGGQTVAIRTGQMEEHIVADVAWAAWHYVEWTGDRVFEEGPGRQLLVETSRYWASRIRLDGDGRGHLFGVIGPDEYHESVDDNAFTNVMARWNLRRAADVAGSAVSPEERHRWLDLADRLVDNLDSETRIYEQFAGFFGLEPLVIKDVAPRRPVVADLLLGRDRVQEAQVVKQADVLMLHHLVPEEVAEGSLEPNLTFYEPRTAHGSSLSPGVHASLFARAGFAEPALRWLRLAARIDLEDLTGTTAGGLHLATLGMNWQALAYGFLGLRPDRGVLHIDPRLPPEWPSVSMRLLFQGRRIGLTVTQDTIGVDANGPVHIRLPGVDAPIEVTQERRFRRSATAWEV